MWMNSAFLSFRVCGIETAGGMADTELPAFDASDNQLFENL